jgi:hypothetical protein
VPRTLATATRAVTLGDDDDPDELVSRVPPIPLSLCDEHRVAGYRPVPEIPESMRRKWLERDA